LQIADHVVVMRQGRVVGDMPRAAATTDGLVGLITGDVSFRNRA
jgi:ABC-type sugar transport system ATPase subunit